MSKSTIKIGLIVIFALYIIVKCGGGVVKDSDGKIVLNSRVSTQEVAKEPIINSINPIFIFNSYVEAIGIYKERGEYASKILDEMAKTSDEEISKGDRSEIKSEIIIGNNYNGEEVIDRHLSATARVSLFTPFILLFCIVAIIVAVSQFRWEKLGSPYFDKFLK
ncbi:MAG: hypothetical protein R3Y44_07020 [Rikenellaceae bacterium]